MLAQHICNSEDIIQKKSDLVCNKCGLIIGQRYERIARRAFSQEQKEKRITHHPWPELPFSSQTLLSWSKYDAKGNYIKNIKRFYRLRKLNRQRTYKDRMLVEAYYRLKTLENEINIPPIVFEETLFCFSLALEKRYAHGGSVIALLVAAFSCACHLWRKIILIDNICELFQVSRQRVTKYRERIFRGIITPKYKKNYIPFNYEEYTYFFMRQIFQESSEYIIYATMRKYLEQFKKQKIKTLGKDPKGIAAAILYEFSILIDQKKSQKFLSNVCSITEVTLRNNYKRIKMRMPPFEPIRKKKNTKI